MESKYYTSSIEEFYVGFEYEDFNPKDESFAGDWVSKVFDAGDYEWLVNYKHITDLIRVKYLDKEDIESLGFASLGSMWFFKQDCLTVNGENFLNCKIRMWNNNQLDIYADYKDNDELQLVFRGVVKNKSELVKVFKMIGVV